MRERGCAIRHNVYLTAKHRGKIMKEKKIWVGKRTYHFGRWFTLIEVSVMEKETGEGGSYVFDTIANKGKERLLSEKFWKQVKRKAKTFKDCEIIFQRLTRYPSDLWKGYNKSELAFFNDNKRFMLIGKGRVEPK